VQPEHPPAVRASDQEADQTTHQLQQEQDQDGDVDGPSIHGYGFAASPHDPKPYSQLQHPSMILQFYVRGIFRDQDNALETVREDVGGVPW
jgi:hypothetical protein